MKRQADVAFSALVGLDPIANEQGTDQADPLAAGAGAATGVSIARILAAPRPGRSSARPVLHQRRRSGTPRRTRSRYGVLGLAVSAALAIAATLLWVTPSAGAPSRQAVAPSVHADHTPLSNRTAPHGLTFADHAPKVTGATALP